MANSYREPALRNGHHHLRRTMTGLNFRFHMAAIFAFLVASFFATKGGRGSPAEPGAA